MAITKIFWWNHEQNTFENINLLFYIINSIGRPKIVGREGKKEDDTINSMKLSTSINFKGVNKNS